MKRRDLKLLLLASLLGAAVSVVETPQAQANPAEAASLWGQRAQSATRLAVIDGGGLNIDLPKVVKHLFVGTNTEEVSVHIGELNGQPGQEQVGLDGGAVTALAQDMSVMWTSDDIGARRIIAVQDLDADGAAEILVETEGQEVAIVSGSNGQIAFTFDYVGGRMVVVDIDGDDGLEILVQSAGGAPGLRAYGFDNGNGQLLWQVTEGISEQFDLAVGDVNPENTDLEVALDGDSGAVVVINAASGNVERNTGANIDGDFGCGPSVVANIDEDVQEELIFTGTASGENGETAYLAVYDYVEDTIEWIYEYGHGNADVALRMLQNPTADLNGDGVMEVIVSVFNNTEELVDGQPEDADGINEPGRWTLVAYDGATGEVVAQAPDQLPVALLDPSGMGKSMLLTASVGDDIDPDNPMSSLTAWAEVDGELSQRWTVPNARLAKAPGLYGGTCAPGSRVFAAVVHDFTGDERPDVVVERDLNGDQRADLVQIMGFTPQGPTITGQTELAPFQNPHVIAAGDGFFENGAHLAMVLSDGFLTVFNGLMEPEQRFPSARNMPQPRTLQAELPNPEDEETTIKTRYLHLQDAAGRTRNIDAGGRRPLDVYSSDDRGTAQPLVGLFVDGGSLFAHNFDNDNGDPVLSMRNAFGEEVWSHTFEDALAGPRNVLAAPLDGDEGNQSTQDIAYIYTDRDGNDIIEVRLGPTGELVASRAVNDIQSGVEEPWMVAQGNGGTTHRLVLMADGQAHWLAAAGTPGLEALETEYVVAISEEVRNNVSFKIDADVDIPFLFADTPEGDKALINADTGEARWTIPVNGDNHSYQGQLLNFPSLVRQGPNEIELDSVENLNLIVPGSAGDLSSYTTNSGQVNWRVCLNDGQATAMPTDQPPTTQNCGGGKLSDVTVGSVVQTIDDVREIMVGSEDGWVYALTSQGELIWALYFGVPVGAPIMTDPIGGGEDSKVLIVVPAANGSIFFVERDFTPTGEVRDVAVDGDRISDPNTDVDEAEQFGALGVAWEPVEDAEGYRVALVGSDGLVTPFEDQGDATSAVLTDLPLRIGPTYRALVVAYDIAGVESAAISSDGVVLSDNTAPEIVDFAVAPEAFNPNQDEPVALTGQATDNFGVATVELAAMRDEDDGPVWTRTIDAGAVAQFDLNEVWDGRADGDIVPDGQYTITMRVVDVGDNEETAEATLLIDATAPDAPTITAPEDGAVLTEGVVTVSGGAEPGSTVNVTIDGEQLCEVEVDDTGGFECTTEDALADGQYTAAATATDALGNTSEESAQVVFTIDTTAPDAPVITSPTDGQEFEGESVEVTIEGTAEAGADVNVSVGDEVVCEVTADEAGVFACPAQTFEVGEYTATASAIDGAGLESEVSEAVGFVVIKPVIDPNNEPNNSPNNEPNNDPNNDPGPDPDPNPNVDTGSPDDGCGCSTPSRPAPSNAPLALLALALGGFFWRRRR